MGIELRTAPGQMFAILADELVVIGEYTDAVLGDSDLFDEIEIMRTPFGFLPGIQTLVFRICGNRLLKIICAAAVPVDRGVALAKVFRSDAVDSVGFLGILPQIRGNTGLCGKNKDVVALLNAAGKSTETELKKTILEPLKTNPFGCVGIDSGGKTT